MKKRTVFGVGLSILGIILLLLLGLFLMKSSKKEAEVNLEAFLQNTDLLEESISQETETCLSSESSETSAFQNTPPETETSLAVNPETDSHTVHQIIFVGDSRTVGMGLAMKQADPEDTCIYIGEVGEGYHWFTQTGIFSMEESIKKYPDAPIVLNLGINDPDLITEYIALYTSFSQRYPDSTFYFMSVNPVTEKCETRTNLEISDFNSQLRSAFPDQYLDCNTYLRILEFESADGIHYSDDTYVAVHEFTVKKLFS